MSSPKGGHMPGGQQPYSPPARNLALSDPLSGDSHYKPNAGAAYQIFSCCPERVGKSKGEGRLGGLRAVGNSAW